MKEAVEHLRVNLGKKVADNQSAALHFEGINGEPLVMSKDSFYPIDPKMTLGLITFVDGGNCEIIKGSSFSLQFIRVYASTFASGARISSQKKEFFAYLYATEENGTLIYKSVFFDCDLLDEADFIIAASDASIKNGSTRGSLSSLGSIIRRCAELAIAAKLIDAPKKEGMIVLDGSLQGLHTVESKFLAALYDKAIASKTVICALSKTSQLLSSKGSSIVSHLNAHAPNGPWICHPLCILTDKNYRAYLSFVKLHPKSSYVFKFEIYGEQKGLLMQATNALAYYCSDPIFLGYPYGLIEADQRARISNEEKGYLQLHAKLLLGKDWKHVEEEMHMHDAHDILDSMR